MELLTDTDPGTGLRSASFEKMAVVVPPVSFADRLDAYSCLNQRVNLHIFVSSVSMR